MDTEIKDLLDKFQKANDDLKALKEQHDSELKAAQEGNAEAKKAVEGLEAKLTEQAEKHEKALDELAAKMQRPGSQGMGGDQPKSLGAQFVESEIYSEVKANARGNDQPFEAKDITGTSGSAIALVDPDRDPTVYRTIGGRRQLRIADLIPSVPTSSGSVEIMRQDSFTNNAGPQEAGSSPSTAAGGGELETKAQSNITWELVTVPVRTIAHWVPASRQALSDAPMLQGLIDTELTYGLQLESDAQLLNGDGAGQSLTGILQDGAINDVGELESGTDPADVPAAMIDHIREAVTECQKSEYYNMNGLVLNPVDWQTLETAKATDGHYLLVAFAPTAGETPTVWRVPVVVTNAIAEGTFLIGDWSMGATIYRREGVSVRVSESHADYFVRNGVAILAEERYCLAVNRPKAFTKGSFAVAA